MQYGIGEANSIILEELLHAVNELKNRKSPGLNGINAELLKHGGIVLHLCLLHSLKMCWKEHKISREWSKGKIISVFKKGDQTNADNYREIYILDTAYEVNASVVNETEAKRRCLIIRRTKWLQES